MEKKIEEQAEFVEWWREKVRDKGKRSNNADPRYFVEDAEKMTGITQQQVSKWAKRLTDRETYRQRLYGAGWRAAMGTVENPAQLIVQSNSVDSLGVAPLPATSESASNTSAGSGARRAIGLRREGL